MSIRSSQNSMITTGPPKVPTPTRLRGEAAPGAYEVRTRNGEPADAGLAVFPIIRYDKEGHAHLTGTGFFISTTGLFVTARHVLMDSFDSKGAQQYSLGIIQLAKGNKCYQRPVLRCTSRPDADVAVGVVAPMKSVKDGSPLTNPILTLTTDRPETGARVTTYAYPKHANVLRQGEQQIINFVPTFYDGEIEEYYANGRDRTLLPGPCYRTSIIIHGGASGGPVFCRNGSVFAVNSTGFDGTDVSYISRIDEILNFVIEGVAMGQEPARSVRVSELVRAGHILVSPPL